MTVRGCHDLSSTKRMAATAAVCLVAAMTLAAPAAATNRIVGDSLSAGPNDTSPIPWPVVAFGADFVNHSVGGAATYDFLDWCGNNPNGCWANQGDPDDVYWMMLGTNDLQHDPDATGADYAANLVALADLIETKSGSTDIRLISSPWAFDLGGLDRQPLRDYLDVQAMEDQALCAIDARFTCVADLRLVLTFPDDYLSDNVHLSVAGHAAAAAAIVPEPATVLLCGAGTIMLGSRRHRRRAGVAL